jgi:hypothetical protein
MMEAYASMNSIAEMFSFALAAGFAFGCIAAPPPFQSFLKPAPLT